MMQIELMKLWDSDRKTVLFVTHSVDEGGVSCPTASSCSAASPDG